MSVTGPLPAAPPLTDGAQAPPPHAVARLREVRRARSTRPYVARGSHTARCERCRVVATQCICARRPAVRTRAAVCLLMHPTEPLRPSNTGWLVADVVADTFAFAWSRTQPDPDLLALLRDSAWAPFVVFPADAAAAPRVARTVTVAPGRCPLFVVLDGTWAETRKMFRRSPYLDGFPLLELPAGEPSRYCLRRNHFPAHLCTAEVAAACLHMAGEEAAAAALHVWLDAFVDVSMTARGLAAPSATLPRRRPRVAAGGDAPPPPAAVGG